MHRATQRARDRLLAEEVLTDERLGRLRPLVAETQPIEHARRRVHAEGEDEQVVCLRRIRSELDARPPLLEANGVDPAAYRMRSPLYGHPLEMAVEALEAADLEITRSWSAGDGADAELVERCLDAHAALIRMQHVRVDAALHDGGRQIDPIDGEHLDQRLRDDPAAHVASGRRQLVEVACLVEVHTDRAAGALAQVEHEVAEERPGRAGPDHGDLGVVVEPERRRGRRAHAA